MNRSCPRLLVLLSLVVAATVALPASTSRFWQTSTHTDLLKGDIDQLSIDEAGRLVLGPAMRVIYDASVPFIWCLAALPDGSVAAGTGNDGQVLRIDAAGTATVWFDPAELEVHAMVPAPGGGLYVATSPDGRVYRLDAQGKASVVFDPEDKYIWSLAVDSQGRLYVGTGGDKGRIYRVDTSGAATVFHTTSAAHVTALAIDPSGRLIAGTDSPARVITIDGAGRGFVVLDSPYREIRAIRVSATGHIYAAAVNGKASAEPAGPSPAIASPQPSAPVGSVSTEITAVTMLDAPSVLMGSGPPPLREASQTPKGAVYRIDADGSAEPIWESREDIPFDILPDDPDGIMVSTGNDGKIFRVAGNPSRATLVARVAGQQATALLTVGATRYVATSNPARLITLGASLAREGTYTSDVRDADTVSTWGTISWHAMAGADGRVKVFTRSGNTATPDDTWAPWAGPYTRATGESIQSPAARYLQWKVILSAPTGKGPAPALASLSVAYLQRNLRPRVTDITVNPPGVVFQRPYPTGEPEIAGLDTALPESRFPVFSMPLGMPMARGSAPAIGRRLYQKGLRAFMWKAEDGNDDRLIYDLHFRRVGEGSWRPFRLATLDELAVWDTTSVADGTYVLRVTASDRLNNLPAATLMGEMESEAFDIDNTAPCISVLGIRTEGSRSIVTAEVVDTTSVVDRVEYAIDAGPWQPAFPLDGAADSRHERYEIAVEGPAAGRLVIRATDTMNNMGTQYVSAPSATAAAPPAK
jgi:hypothetical protein